MKDVDCWDAREVIIESISNLLLKTGILKWLILRIDTRCKEGHNELIYIESRIEELGLYSSWLLNVSSSAISRGKRKLADVEGNRLADPEI